jgi:hypothetical protein
MWSGFPLCTLAIYVRSFQDFPAIVAANRDEFFSRPASAPLLLDENSGIFGGRDEAAGGTWLAVNRRGVVAALLNRRTDEPADPQRESRGRLCLEILRQPSAEAARAAIAEQLPLRYNPFNLLVADAHDAWVATNHGAVMRVTELDPGLHLTIPRARASRLPTSSLPHCSEATCRSRRARSSAIGSAPSWPLTTPSSTLGAPELATACACIRSNTGPARRA